MDDSNPFLALLVTILLIGVNGLLASSEIAMVGLNEKKLAKKAGEGDKKAGLLLRMKREPSDFLSTVQIGITLAGLLSGAFAADSLAKPIVAFAQAQGVSGTALSAISIGSVILVTFIITYFMLVFGELVPKRVAMASPEKTASFIIGPLNALSKVTRPLVRLLAVSTNGVLRLAGIDPDQEEIVTEEDIMLMTLEGMKQGTIERSEAEFVANVFDFTDSPVEEGMVHRTEIKALPLDATFGDMLALVAETGHGRFPVYEENIDRIVGIAYSKDIVARYASGGARDDRPIKDIMRSPYYVFERKKLSALFAEMKKSRNTMAVVVDEYGGTSGIITMTDIIEEIIGDIEPDDTDIQQTPEGFVMDGRAEMEDVVRALSLPERLEEEYDTLSGFITAQLGHVPASGELAEVRREGWVFRVLTSSGSIVGSVQVTRDAKEE